MIFSTLTCLNKFDQQLDLNNHKIIILTSSLSHVDYVSLCAWDEVPGKNI